MGFTKEFLNSALNSCSIKIVHVCMKKYNHSMPVQMKGGTQTMVWTGETHPNTRASYGVCIVRICCMSFVVLKGTTLYKIEPFLTGNIQSRVDLYSVQSYRRNKINLSTSVYPCTLPEREFSISLNKDSTNSATRVIFCFTIHTEQNRRCYIHVCRNAVSLDYITIDCTHTLDTCI